ncbi:MAG: hypothetical protein HC800_09795 [Phormidesmis sp. RL_2_1]|nr:hypothetical protein [Phormidesmis sp. RL_2_1]
MKVRSFLQPLLRQNYYVTHSYHLLRLWREGLNRRGKIIIYQMGKVGSTTIWKSLESANLGVPLYHVHTLSPEKIDKRVEYDRINFSKRRFIYYESMQAEYLRGQIDHNQVNSSWRLITLVRDPIAKMISSFFQKLEIEIPLGLDYRKEVAKEGEEKVLKSLSERFCKECVYNSDWEHPFEWFNHEIRANFDVDIFSETPLSGKDYCIYDAGTAKILLLKLESLNTCYESAFQEFLGLQNFNLVQSNIGSQKLYKNLYKAFLEQVDFPIDYIDKVYNSELIKHCTQILRLRGFTSAGENNRA